MMGPRLPIVIILVSTYVKKTILIALFLPSLAHATPNPVDLRPTWLQFAGTIYEKACCCLCPCFAKLRKQLREIGDVTVGSVKN